MAVLHNGTAYNAGTEALKGQSLDVGTAKAVLLQFTAADGYDGTVTVEISPDAGTTWFTLQTESLAALTGNASTIADFGETHRALPPAHTLLRTRMSGGTAVRLPTAATTTAFAPNVTANADSAYVVKVLGYTPTAFYKHNEASGAVIIDYSGNGVDGTYYDPDPGAYRGGTFLDGTPAYYTSYDSIGSAYADALVLGDNPFLWAGSFTLWINPSSLVTDPDELWLTVDYYGWVVGDTDRCEIKLVRISATQMTLIVNRGVEQSHTFNYTADEWMHIAVTTNDTETKLYVNGVLEATLTGYGTNNFALDYNSSFYNYVYSTTGYLSYCAYWGDTILTAPQIADLAIV